jgi:hypothetical protein
MCIRPSVDVSNRSRFFLPPIPHAVGPVDLRALWLAFEAEAEHPELDLTQLRRCLSRLPNYNHGRSERSDRQRYLANFLSRVALLLDRDGIILLLHRPPPPPSPIFFSSCLRLIVCLRLGWLNAIT